LARVSVSIICPVFNEEKAVPLFYDRLVAAIAPLRQRYDFELLFTNDGSVDGTLRAIRELRERDASVQVLTLSRNFGYEAGISAGMRHARGDLIVVLDVDCEDPPEMIPQFIAEWEAGHDVVYGRRDKRVEPLAWQLSRKTFYRLNRLIADSEIVLDMGNFFLVTAAVRDAALSQSSTVPFLRSEVAYVGFKRKGIPYSRQQRIAGQSHYNLWRATKFAVTGILSSTTFPLRVAVWSFPLLVLANVLLEVFDDFRHLVILDLLYIAFFLMVICIYLARTYKDVVQRPLNVVDWNQSHYNHPRP
jgi:glycosyltransferase involved in cell wall biosynthesis